jgi:ParB-like chromosome segregation protein Spo0J
MKLSDIKLNPDNPRTVKDENFEKLKKSITEFPKMMSLRPIVIDSNNMVLGGNHRLKALKDLGFKELPDDWVVRADTLTDEEARRFIIADNVSTAEWDWNELELNWDLEQLEEWGLDVPIFNLQPSYEDLIGEEKNKPATLKITFESPEQLQKAEIDIQELLDRKYPKAYFSVSAGEI